MAGSQINVNLIYHEIGSLSFISDAKRITIYYPIIRTPTTIIYITIRIIIYVPVITELNAIRHTP